MLYKNILLIGTCLPRFFFYIKLNIKTDAHKLKLLSGYASCHTAKNEETQSTSSVGQTSKIQ